MTIFILVLLTIICHGSGQLHGGEVELLDRKFSFSERYIYTRHINNMDQTCESILEVISSIGGIFNAALETPLNHAKAQFNKATIKDSTVPGCEFEGPDSKRYADIYNILNPQKAEFKKCLPTLKSKGSKATMVKEVTEYRKKVNSVRSEINECLDRIPSRKTFCASGVYDDFISRYNEVKESLESQCIDKLVGSSCATSEKINKVVTVANQFLRVLRGCIDEKGFIIYASLVNVTLFDDIIEAYEKNEDLHSKIDEQLEHYLNEEQKASKAKLMRTETFFKNIVRSYVARFASPEIVPEEKFSDRSRSLKTYCADEARKDVRNLISKASSEYAGCDDDIDLEEIKSEVDNTLNRINLPTFGESAVGKCIKSNSNHNFNHENKPILKCYNQKYRSISLRWEEVSSILQKYERLLNVYSTNNHPCGEEKKREIQREASKINKSYQECLRGTVTVTSPQPSNTIFIGEIEIDFKK